MNQLNKLGVMEAFKCNKCDEYHWREAKEYPYHSNWIEKILCSLGSHLRQTTDGRLLLYCIRCNKKFHE